jgi:hypothetical protein
MDIYVLCSLIKKKIDINRITPVLLKTGQIILDKYSIGRSLRMGLIWLDFRLLVYKKLEFALLIDAVDRCIVSKAV